MEGNLQPHALIPGGVSSDLEQPLHFVAQAQTQVVQANQVTFAAPVENQMQELGNGEKASLISKEDPRGKATASASQWPCRVNWSADMAKLLVSAVSYVDDDIDDAEHGSRVRRMGKWSLVSSAMTERGFAASPQQCADKFHDLNKRYKRVTEILGWGTACKIVEKPALLEQMNISEKLKEEARKHLSSKNLHYEQMCSYHNHNRVSLLDDPVLQKMLRRMARGSPVEQGKKCTIRNVEDDLMLLSDDEEEDEEFNDDLEVSAEEHRHQGVHATKKLKHDREEGSHLSQDVAINMKIIQIQRERLKIRRETLEMRQSHLERMKSHKEQDKELQKMRLDNEMMELENDQLELEMERKIKEMEMMGIKPQRI
ncbi:hypothetical protein SETIT_1G163600v2 [Setaria italica]|uniref:Myb/SANT-like DNA-binding domain-containing protein n=2 Tax=Setaria TaxID=4554 RepID=K3YXS3_SETIT|nr:uncharacterized protein LOC101760040 [Setaria italica]XP_034604730.1 uncharacterized protein LOC117864425 [Setaria viridis]RCV06453.1 hypothetical protein SETIT_1G163600v2 [Setaria italica]TKW39232.1 hypothetical protein SEVIR_1G165500v2 [Setaria viridis]